MNYDLLIAKLGALSFQKDVISFMKSYLTTKQQWVHVNSTLGAWERVISGVLQGSTLAPMLFKMFSNDLFSFIENSDLSSYVNGNMLYSCGNNSEQVKQLLRGDFQIVTVWFYENYMILNLVKCHFMCLGQKTEKETFFSNNTEMKINSKGKILGIVFDNKHEFKINKNLYKRASQKIWALSRLINYLSEPEKI